MMSFLNTLFEGQRIIADLNFGQTEYAGVDNQYKKVFFDLMCTSEDGSQMIIEMQRNPQSNFDGRCVYYLSKIISEQLFKGEADKYGGLKNVCLIGVLDFKFEDSAVDEYFHEIGLKNHKNGNIFYDKLDLKFLELPSFNKTEKELVTDLDKWFYILKNMRQLDRIPDCMDKPVFQKIFKIAEMSNLTKEERMFFDANSKAEWDYKRSIEYAAEQAEEKGRQVGKQEGRKEGKLEGIDVGMIKANKLTAKRLIEQGFQLELICKITDLPREIVENL